MADSKLSELSYVTGLTSSDLLYVVQGGISNKIAASSLAVSLQGLNITAATPTYSTSLGTKGQIKYDNSYLYICVTSNTWIRSAITSSW
jgi:hypothetical protein